MSAQTMKRLRCLRIMQDGQIPNSKWSTRAVFKTKALLQLQLGQRTSAG